MISWLASSRHKKRCARLRWNVTSNAALLPLRSAIQHGGIPEYSITQITSNPYNSCEPALPARRSQTNRRAAASPLRELLPLHAIETGAAVGFHDVAHHAEVLPRGLRKVLHDRRR